MSKEFQIFIDRLEGDMAVLLSCENAHELVIPKKFLPKGARAGSVLTATFKLEPELTTKAREVVCDLIAELSHTK